MRFLFWLLISASLAVHAGPKNGTGDICSHDLVGLQMDGEGIPHVLHPSVEITTVTGEATNPTAMLLHRMDLLQWLDPGAIDQARTKTTALKSEGDLKLVDKIHALKNPEKIVSLGEGYGGVVPYLRQHGLNAVGLDLWYGSDVSELRDAIGGLFMIQYLNKYRPYLVAGSMTEMPFADESADLLLAHNSTYFLKPELQKDLLREALRVLRPGGIMIVINHLQSQDPMADAAREMGLHYLWQTLHHEYAGAHRISSFPADEYNALYFNSHRPPPDRTSVDRDVQRLIIYKD
jgi:SAM-dependent methyltransferase